MIVQSIENSPHQKVLLCRANWYANWTLCTFSNEHNYCHVCNSSRSWFPALPYGVAAYVSEIACVSWQRLIQHEPIVSIMVSNDLELCFTLSPQFVSFLFITCQTKSKKNLAKSKKSKKTVAENKNYNCYHFATFGAI